jgi:hypothetical protein
MEEFLEQCQNKLKINSALHENTECIVWTGCINKFGYGQFRYRDPRDPLSASYRTRTSHRVALMIYFRNFDVPASQQASHLCNNKLCINVEHLVFENNSTNNLRKNCFSHSRCLGHFDDKGERLADCLVHLSTA